MKRLIIIIFLILVSSLPVYAEIELTEEELAFIEEHPIIHMGSDPVFVPFEFVDKDGLYKGIAYDYIKLIEAQTGLRFEVEEGLTWSQAYEKAVEKELDVLPSVHKTKDRERFFLFSQGYYTFQRVIVMSVDSESIKDYHDLLGKQVAVQKNSSHHSLLKEYPEIETLLYPDVESALRDVASGKVNYFVGNLATTNYWMKDLGFTDMKFVEFDDSDDSALHFAVRNDWPELQSIIDKALDNITTEEKLAITNRWITVEYGRDYTILIRNLLIIGSIILLIVMVSFFWVYRLKAEIKKRIAIEKDLVVAKAEAETATAVKSNFIARMSHEIRTPLNAINGLSYLIMNSELNKTQRAHMEKLKNASDTMLSIINDILDISKIEAGKIELETESFDLDEVITNALSIITFRAEEKKLHLTLTKDPQLPTYYFGDQVRIGQILLNLLNNAVKFTDQGDVSLNIGLYGFEKDIYTIEFSEVLQQV